MPLYKPYFFVGIPIIILLWFSGYWGYINMSIPIVLTLIYLVVIVLGVTNIDYRFFVNSYCFKKTQQKLIAITFDDGLDPQNTPIIQNICLQYGIPATFFIIGKKIKGNEQLLQSLAQNDFTIANHTYSHGFWIDLLSTKKFKKEIEDTNLLIQGVTGLKPKFFRPPYGVTNPNISQAIAQTNMHSIGWNKRSFDTSIKSKEQLLSRVKKMIEPGAVFLFHDTQTITADILTTFIQYAQKEGYTFVSIESLFDLQAYE